jgi:hypothetical protein
MSLKNVELRDKRKVFNEILTKHGQFVPVKPYFAQLKEDYLKDFSPPTLDELNTFHETVLKKYPPPDKPRERSGGVSGQRPGLSAPQPATDDLKYTIEFKSDQEKNNLVEAIKRQWGKCSVDVFAAEQVGAASEKIERRVGRIAVDYD